MRILLAYIPDVCPALCRVTSCPRCGVAARGLRTSLSGCLSASSEDRSHRSSSSWTSPHYTGSTLGLLPLFFSIGTGYQFQGFRPFLIFGTVPVIVSSDIRYKMRWLYRYTISWISGEGYLCSNGLIERLHVRFQTDCTERMAGLVNRLQLCEKLVDKQTLVAVKTELLTDTTKKHHLARSGFFRII